MIFDKLFKKKVKDKPIIKFWQEFEERSEFYLDVIANDSEDSEDYLFVCRCIKEGLRLCAIDAEIAYDFSFNKESSPMRFTFHHNNDEYLKGVAERLCALYPQNLKEKMLFLTAE